LPNPFRGTREIIAANLGSDPVPQVSWRIAGNAAIVVKPAAVVVGVAWSSAKQIAPPVSFSVLADVVLTGPAETKLVK
jgi:hypothetical protein